MSRSDPPKRGNVVPSGCVLTTTLLVIAIAIAGYFGYRYFAGALELPPELEPYKELDSVRAQIRSRAPAPPEGTRLDERWLAFYLEAIDSTGGALLASRDVIDSMYTAARSRGDTGITSLVTSPMFYRAIGIVGPTTKRALVSYLNARNRSFDEYVWAKERTLAATDITQRTADSALRRMVGRYFGAVDSNVTFGGKAIGEWFERIESLRSSGAVSPEERALVAPHRRRIVERGLGSLYGFDTDVGP